MSAHLCPPTLACVAHTVSHDLITICDMFTTKLVMCTDTAVTLARICAVGWRWDWAGGPCGNASARNSCIQLYAAAGARGVRKHRSSAWEKRCHTVPTRVSASFSLHRRPPSLAGTRGTDEAATRQWAARNAMECAHARRCRSGQQLGWLMLKAANACHGLTKLNSTQFPPRHPQIFGS